MINGIDCYHTTRLLNKLSRLNVQKKVKKVDINQIKQAIYYAKKYHGDQTRQSGEPFYSHPIEVAYIVSDYLFDTETIIAALLHDIIEDTHISLNHVELIFGENIAKIVDSLTKITMDYQLSKEEIYSKINCFNDIGRKAITIKVIDRLHNMRTIHHIKSIDKQKRIAKDTLEVYTIFAQNANLYKVKDELETLSKKILKII